MKCKWTKLLLSYNDELGLDPKRKEIFAKHLKECPICQKEVDGLVTTVKIISEMEELDPPRNYIEIVGKYLKKY